MGRLSKLPPYLFSQLDAAQKRARAAGVDVVDLGIGDPDQPTPAELLDRMAEAIRQPAHHRYPSGEGAPELREAIAAWLARRHGVHVDPQQQIQVLIGSKEGLAHLPLAYVEEGDNVLVPNLGYPVYGEAVVLAGAQPRAFRLDADRGFRPDPTELSRLADRRSRLLFVNYPNNPTGAVADTDLWRALTSLATERGLVLVNDAAYLELSLDGSRPTSLLAVADCAVDRVVELHSFSKMFNMTGWRIGFAVGNAEVIADLRRVKQTIDSGVFTAIQSVAAYALGERFDALLADVLAPYPRRREIIVAALGKADIEVFPTAATFYVWARVPSSGDSIAFCAQVLAETGVVVAPGVGFGPGGEGWFRISLTAPDERIAVAAERLVGAALRGRS